MEDNTNDIKVSVENLIVEVTRECNMKCEICLRGDSEHLRMQFDTIDRLLDNITEVDCVTFSGGEPALALDVIRYFFDSARKHDVKVNSFYVITNGSVNQLALATLLLEEYGRLDDPDPDENPTGVCISCDGWHDAEEQSKEIPYVRYLSFYRPSHERIPSQWFDERYILPRGRAAENGIGRNNRPVKTEFTISHVDWDTYSIEELYLSCNGWIYPDYNLSYDMMDEKDIGSPLEDIKSIVKRHIEEVEK